MRFFGRRRWSIGGISSMVDVVVLAGSIGHEPEWTSDTVRPLLPLPGSTLLESLLGRLQASLGGKTIVCANGRTQLIARHLEQHRRLAELPEMVEDRLPLGTAGCLKACESRIGSDTFFVAGGAVWLDDAPQWMLERHRSSGNDLTVFCTHDPGWSGASTQNHLRSAGIYCCKKSVLGHVRNTGFQDLKEQLVPALQRAGLRVGAVQLRGTTRR
jgi:NDP-sugar pyrophosphorylase family protein